MDNEEKVEALELIREFLHETSGIGRDVEWRRLHDSARRILKAAGVAEICDEESDDEC